MQVGKKILGIAARQNKKSAISSIFWVEQLRRTFFTGILTASAASGSSLNINHQVLSQNSHKMFATKIQGPKDQKADAENSKSEVVVCEEEKQKSRRQKKKQRQQQEELELRKQRQQFRFNRFEEQAKYDGRTKYEKPKYSYNYDVRYKHVDSSLPATQWAYDWFKNTQKDTLEFLLDMTIRGNVNAVMFKVAGFTKRQVNRMCTMLNWFGGKSWVVWQATKHGVSHMVHGLKTLFKDGKWVVKHQVKHSQSQYVSSSFAQKQKVTQVRKDFIKFVPFSLFLLIPGGELFLPAWVLIFPNSVPSQFVSDEERVKKFEQLLEKQEDAAEKLLYVLPNYLARLSTENEIWAEEQKKLSQVKSLLKQDTFMPTDFLEYRNLFRKYGKFRMFKTKTLMHMAHFMSISPVTGLNTINNILKIFKLKIPVDAPVLHMMTQLLVARELNMYFRRIRQEDLTLDLEDMDNFSQEELTKVCFQRGININESRSRQLKDLKLWLSISNKRNVPHSLLLIIRLHDFNTSNFQIDENETEAEILRRSKSDAYYIESVRAFEKAFGMDKLERIISETQAKRNLLMQDPLKNKFIFQAKDLEAQMNALDEFKTRHRTITDRIHETYKIGNQMMDYLENQIILDHHFRGEQDQFEQEYPHLKLKAEKLLTYETYFDLSPLTGSPLTEKDQPVLYGKLMKIQQKITSNLGEHLLKHNVRLDQFEEDITIGTTMLNEAGKNQPEVKADAEELKNQKECPEELIDTAEELKQVEDEQPMKKKIEEKA